MRTKPLDRLLFAQGGECFFCHRPLPREDASIEHLVAATHGGKDNDENLVACCQALNTLFGRMSLKEKLAVILKQKGAFQCPARTADPAAAPRATPTPAPEAAAPTRPATALPVVLAGLRKRGNARPRTLDALATFVTDLLEQNGFPVAEAKDVMARLHSRNQPAHSLGPMNKLCPLPNKPSRPMPAEPPPMTTISPLMVGPQCWSVMVYCLLSSMHTRVAAVWRHAQLFITAPQ